MALPAILEPLVHLAPTALGPHAQGLMALPAILGLLLR